MKQLKLRVTGDAGRKPVIKIDGKYAKLAKNKFGANEGIFQTEKDEMEVEVYRYLEINSKLWILMSILYFIVGIFGILDPWYDRTCKVIEFKIKVKLQEQNEVKLVLYNPKEDRVRVETQCEYEEEFNTSYVDLKAKKRYKIWLAAKLIGTIVCVIAAIAIALAVGIG